MKSIILLGSFFYFLFPQKIAAQTNSMYAGAWQNQNDAGETICMMDGYFVYAKFNVAAKTFGQTWGGPYSIDGKNLKIKLEFDAKEEGQVGKEKILVLEKTGTLLIKGLGADLTMKQLDNGIGPLAGNWRITKRKQGETMNDMPLRPRRTLKLLTGTVSNGWPSILKPGSLVVQVAALILLRMVNTPNRSNSSAVMATALEQQVFNGKVENGDWHHSGRSSTGEPIYEIWSRMK